MDNIYRDVPLANIPWNSEAPPEALVELIDSGKVKPCRAVDLGCGAGNYVIYLAGRGFDATGVDLSPTAIRIARENAAKKGVGCHFIVADVLGDLPAAIADLREVAGLREAGRPFGFAFDWELLHHIFPEEREKYVGNVYRLLEPGGKYFSACFNEADPQFGGPGKYRKTRLGTELYFSSTDELRALFSKHFKILELKAVPLKSKFGPHVINYALLEKSFMEKRA